MCIRDRFNSNRYDYVELVNSPAFVDIRPFIHNGWRSSVYYTYYLNLTKDIDRSISKKTRNIVRKAEKEGITIRKMTDVEEFYKLYSMTYTRQGLNTPVNIEFFDEMISLIKGENMGKMWFAKTSTGELASAEVFVWDEKRAYRWVAGSHSSLRKTGATSYLLYHIFNELKEKGFTEVNLMGANTPHLAMFLTGFNPKLVPYFSVKKTNLLANILEKAYRVIKCSGESY